MDASTSSTFRLAWTRTADGVVVLRYHEDGTTDTDLEALFLAGLGNDTKPQEVPVLVDLRAVPDHLGAGALHRFVHGLPDLTRRVPQRRAYLLGDGSRLDLVEMMQSRAAPLQFEAGCFRRWDEALDWLRGRG